MAINKAPFKFLKHIKCNILFANFLLFLTSCNRNIEDKNLINIYFNNFETEMETDLSSTPYYNLKLSIENSDNLNLNFFCAKSYKNDDKTYSRLYLFDTIKNQIIPIYSNSRILIEGPKKYDIYARIDMLENKNYFELSDDYFSKKLYDIKYLNKLFLKIINRSIIIYRQENKDKKGFMLNQTKPSVIEQNIILEIRKPKLITINEYGIDRKKLRIIKID